jgi:streptogramin lyase
MNDDELDAVLDVIHADLRKPEAPLVLREQIRAIPSMTPQLRSRRSPFNAGRFQHMLSATKFVVAGLVVALFGGFLLASVLTQQDAAPVPGATSFGDLLSRVVTEEVAPGVLKVVSDGTSREFSDGSIENIAFGPGGAIWMAGIGNVFRVGEPGPFSAGNVRTDDIAVGPNGVLWAIAHNASTVGSLVDGEWSRTYLGPGIVPKAIEVAGDGTVWVRGGEELVRVDGETVTAYPFAEAPFLRTDASHHVSPSDFASTPDGSVWLALNRSGAGSPRIARFDGERWEVMRPLGEGEERHAGPLVVSPDGVLWAYLQGCADQDCPVASTRRDRSYLARFDGTSWMVFGEADGVQDVGARHVWVGRMAIASDGTVLAEEEVGLARRRLPSLDGPAQNTWPMKSDGISVHSLSAAPDGSIWAATEEGVFISLPEAAAATE